MNKKIVHLSDTSHPFTSYVDDPNGAGTSPEYREWLSTPTYAPIPTFSSDEVKALESLEGEKSLETLRKEYFREEAHMRVNRYFLGRTGWAWFVHFIVEMTEEYDGSARNTMYRAMDGTTILHMTSLYMSEQAAWESINADIRLMSDIDDDVRTHVIELDKM